MAGETTTAGAGSSTAPYAPPAAAGNSLSQMSKGKGPSDPIAALSLSDIVIGSNMASLTPERQEIIFILMLERLRADLADDAEQGLTDEHLRMLSDDCEAMAQAQAKVLRNIAKPAAGVSPYAPGAPEPVAAPGANPASSWGSFNALPVLDNAGGSSVHVPSEYIGALRHKVYLPLSMFTYTHLTLVAPSVETEKYTDPATMAKVIIPKTKLYLPTELELSKADWDGAWKRYIVAITDASDEDFGRMFRSWYEACQAHTYYHRDDLFPVLRRFDADKRKMFFARPRGFLLHSNLFDGPEGIVAAAADYSIQLASTPRLSPSASSIGPARTFKRPVNRPTPFPPSNRQPTAAVDCCARCGRTGHRARTCTQSTIANGSDPILCDFRDGRFFTRAGGEERCFRFNSGLQCQLQDHSANGKHKCTLCGGFNHPATSCTRTS